MARLEVTKTIKLEISEDEVRFLAALMSKIGGDRETSPRKIADHISSVLEKEVGVQRFYVIVSGNIIFPEGSLNSLLATGK